MKVRLKADVENEFLEKDTVYTVFAIYLNKKTELMIDIESFPSAPFAISSELVDVVDRRLSRYWVFGSPYDKKDTSKCIISFPEWANDKYFFQGIIEGKAASNIWINYKKLIELEYAFENKIKAIDLKENWIQCAICLDAWQVADDFLKNELVKCPSCDEVQLNPKVD